MESIKFDVEETQQVVKMLKVMIGIRDEEVIDFLDGIGIEELSDRDFFLEMIGEACKKVCKLGDIVHAGRAHD